MEIAIDEADGDERRRRVKMEIEGEFAQIDLHREGFGEQKASGKRFFFFLLFGV